MILLASTEGGCHVGNLQKYYDPKKLEKLNIALPLLYDTLEKVVFKIHDCCSQPMPGPDRTILDFLLIVRDLTELLDEFSDVCEKIRREYSTKYREQFFLKIKDYHSAWTKLDMALMLYEDMKK